MCQLLALTCHDPAKRDEIILNVWRAMWLNGQKDGCGAAWFSPEGDIGYFRSQYPAIPTKELPVFVKSGFKESNPVPSDGGFLIIHGRSASAATGVRLANTHPMLELDMEGERVVLNAAMIHNGLVNSLSYDNATDDCTCDSEMLLQAYRDGGIDHVTEHITGRYVFMLLQLVDGVKQLHVVKDNQGNLVTGTYGDGFAFATVPELLLKVNSDYSGDVKDCSVMLFTDKDECTMETFTPGKLFSDNWQINGHGGYSRSYPPYLTETEKKAKNDILDRELNKMQAGLVTEGGI